MRTSDKGIAFLERHEGVVLKAYRDPVGIWTIGAGLTAASGVVTPRSQMKITKAEAGRLLGLALGRNYEPAVARTMPGANQHEFDGAVSFHFNTGAIAKASWVRAWAERNWSEVERRIKLWKKGGGRVLPGLVRRRQEEFNLIRLGDYGAGVAGQSPTSERARFVVSVTPAEIQAMRVGFAKLGYKVGEDPGGIRKAAVMQFQRDHDLTIDGLIGRATLSTLQRMLDARAKAGQDGAVGGTAAAGTAGAEAFNIAALPDWLIWAGLGLAVVWVGYRAWQYRDAVAAKIQTAAPATARFLRRF
ncbi:glycoside hydrolase family protein [Thalassococcus profundi]|jgi:lysozyme|nr:glycoside hydrolase family protein [Thalassococcus profundi]